MGRVGLIGDNSVEYIKKLINIWNNGDCVVIIDWRIPHNIAKQMLLEAGVTKCYIDKRLFGNIDIMIDDLTYYLFDATCKSCELITDEIYEMYNPNDCRSQEA